MAILLFGPQPAFVSSGRAEDLYAPKLNWSAFTGGKLNISDFVFRDLNRNGIYDLEDPPIEDIAVRMTAWDGREVVRWSNSNGFANFSMSVKEAGADISDAGNYKFDVIVPGGWVTTTPDALSQIKTFEIRPGAVADIIVTVPFVAVGLAPDLTIDGGVSAELVEGSKVFATSPQGTKEEVALGADGRFSIPAAPGDWTVTFERAEPSTKVERHVLVETMPVRLSDFYSEPDMVPSLRVPDVLVDFESLTKKSLREVPNGVGGLNWWNFVCLALASGYHNNAVSGNYVAYNSSGHPARISSDEPFDFVGGHFGVAWRSANGETLNFWGWRDGKVVYNDRFTLSNLGPVWFQADYNGIDRLDIYTTHYWQFVADDLRFRTGL